MPGLISPRKVEALRPAFAESDLVPPPRAVRKLALLISLFLVALPGLLLFSPWRQNIPAVGRVVALDPLDRLQKIPAPVTGRLAKVHVVEGQNVEAGEALLELSDLDPRYRERLEQQAEFARQKVQAAGDAVSFYTNQVDLLTLGRQQAIDFAKAELRAAADKVDAEEAMLLAARAEFEQKDADRARRRPLFEKKLVSELDLQKAVAAAVSAEAKVRSVTAKLAQVRSARDAKAVKVEQVTFDKEAKIESTRSLREDARSKLASAEKDLRDAQTKIERQSQQIVRAPRNGVVLRIHGAARSDYVKSGDILIDLVPTTDDLAVELWVRGNDAPLITPGREVRLQFEGWPAVQFAGWPSVAIGTFGGRVRLVDSQDDGGGRFRVLITPDPSDTSWPDLFYTRQGTRANGWVLLDEVSLGYEFWRQLNAFPPSLKSAPGTSGSGEKSQKPAKAAK